MIPYNNKENRGEEYQDKKLSLMACGARNCDVQAETIPGT